MIDLEPTVAYNHSPDLGSESARGFREGKEEMEMEARDIVINVNLGSYSYLYRDRAVATAECRGESPMEWDLVYKCSPTSYVSVQTMSMPLK